MIRLLVVDDSALMRRLIGRVFAAEADFQVEFARDGLEALAAAQRFRPDVVTLDVEMPGLDGLRCLDRLMLERPCPVVMVSALTEEGADATLQALSLGAVDFVTKPAGPPTLAIERFGAALVRAVRSAATARLRPALRLRERVRLRAGQLPSSGHAIPPPPVVPANGMAPVQAVPPVITPAGIAGQASTAFPVVLIGASTGGPPALDAVLQPLPAGFGAAILVAQHMPASFTGPLARRLDRQCAIGVTEVSAPVPIRPGQVYIGRGDADLIVTMRPEGLMAMSVPAEPDYPWHPSTHRLVESAMAHLPAARLAGVLLTGMGNDGAAAMTALAEQGGWTVAESEETAVVWGMPGALVKAGGAREVAPLPAIAGLVAGWVGRP